MKYKKGDKVLFARILEECNGINTKPDDTSLDKYVGQIGVIKEIKAHMRYNRYERKPQVDFQTYVVLFGNNELELFEGEVDSYDNSFEL